MPITYTPLRFPGGKSKIYPFVSSLIESNGLEGCTYAEAFCGGAGLAMKLLLKDEVSRIVLNDIDPAVFSVWDAIVNHPDELCDFVEAADLTIDEWKRMREVYRMGKEPSLELGKAAFYLNRTNRSGILGGGVIGGVGQTGKYKIDARFNAADLCRKIRSISEHSCSVELHNLDVLDFMDEVAPTLGEDSLLYLDPPYVQKGPGLYENSFTDADHRALAKSVQGYGGRWMVTYDADRLIDELYVPSEDWDIFIGEIEVGYSAASTRNVARERLVLGPGVGMPNV